jgi:hypothetical protein
MNRYELEHLLRASKGTTGETEFIIIGSQSVLGKHPDAPRELRQSMELDIYSRIKPELHIEIERNLGELSRFSETYGYYADGVSPDTAFLPAGWEDRLTPICNENTDGATGWCIDPADLTIAKLYAARPKDLAFIRAMLKHHFIRPTQIERLIATFADELIRQRLLNAFALCRRPAL